MTVTTTPGAAVLVCPECRDRGRRGSHGGAMRIGGLRGRCTMCNNFAQNVMRVARQQLMEAHVEEYRQIRLRVEMDLYPQFLDQAEALNYL